MLFSIAANERAALQFDDLASALDAGLPVTTLGGDAAHGDRVLHGILQRRRIKLTPTEDVVLLHAWRAGRASAALRARAGERRQRAALARTIWAGLRYPFLLFVMILLASVATMALVGPWLSVGVMTAYAVAAVLFFLLRRAVRAGDPRIVKLPVVGPIVDGLGELPYLETLHALYGAGVQLAPAHAAAVAAVPPGAVQKRLAIADRILHGGRPLAEALDESLALNPETRSLLATGERAGQLEDALARALARRRDVTGRAIAETARRGGQVAYFIAVAGCVIVIFQFYTGYFALLRR